MELIAYLIDTLHEDLNEIKKKPYIEASDYLEGDDEKGSIESWDNY